MGKKRGIRYVNKAIAASGKCPGRHPKVTGREVATGLGKQRGVQWQLPGDLSEEMTSELKPEGQE